MTATYGTVCDEEICMVTGKEPSHIHPITFLVEKKTWWFCIFQDSCEIHGRRHMGIFGLFLG